MRSIPVLTYHSVRPGGPISPELFEEHLQLIQREGWQTIHCQELYDHITGRREIGRPSIQITFDDGWLDNWLYAFPLLSRYRMRATIFIITSRISDVLEPRSSTHKVKLANQHCQSRLPELRAPEAAFLDAVYGKSTADDFLSWNEIRTMIASGLIEVQSHSHRHDYCWRSSEIVDFNRLRHWKIASATGGDFRIGIPVYKGASSLTGPRYYDVASLRDRFHAEALRADAITMLNHRRAKTIFNRYFRQFLNSLPSSVIAEGSYETREDFEQRVREEMRLSRELIISQTSQECRFLCWPWGDYSAESATLLHEAGFDAAYSLERGPNIFNTQSEAIRRFEIRSRHSPWLSMRLKVFASPLMAAIYRQLHRIR